MTPLNPDPDHPSEGTISDATGNGTTKQKVEEDTRHAQREAGAKAREKAEAGQHWVADEADALSDAIDAAAANLDDHDREGLAGYARELSDHLATAAGQIEGRSVDELAKDAKHLARNNPTQFMLGSIAVGFGLSRFFKASAERDHHENDKPHQADDETIRNDDVWNRTPVQGRDRDMTETNTTSTAPRSGNGRDML